MGGSTVAARRPPEDIATAPRISYDRR